MAAVTAKQLDLLRWMPSGMNGFESVHDKDAEYTALQLTRLGLLVERRSGCYGRTAFGDLLLDTLDTATRATSEEGNATGTPGAVSDHKKDALATPKVEDSVVEVGGALGIIAKHRQELLTERQPFSNTNNPTRYYQLCRAISEIDVLAERIEKNVPAKPVDTGGVEGGGDLWATGFGVVDTALNWFTMNYRTTDDEKAAIAKARQILSTEKPTDSMGGETDKENGRSDDLRGVTNEGQAGSPEAYKRLVEVTEGDLREILKETRSLQGQLEEVRRMANLGEQVAGDVYAIAEEGIVHCTIFKLAADHAIELENDEAVYWRGAQVTAHCHELLDDIRRPALMDLSEHPVAWAERTGRDGMQDLKDSAASDSEAVTPTINQNVGPSPQPEKREGPHCVGETMPGSYVVLRSGETFPVYYSPSTFKHAEHIAGLLDEAFLAGQKAQPEGDERLTTDELNQIAELPKLWRMQALHQGDHFEIAADQLAAALGSGEGGER